MYLATSIARALRSAFAPTAGTFLGAIAMHSRVLASSVYSSALRTIGTSSAVDDVNNRRPLTKIAYAHHDGSGRRTTVLGSYLGRVRPANYGWLIGGGFAASAAAGL
jgi:hypothetical protein